MSKPKLYYFDAPVSRGEECRLALHLAGVDFEDVRIKGADWPMHKPKTPFGSMPVLEIEGKPALAQSNAILVFVGRKHGLHPKDDFEAARHEAMMMHVEDLRASITPTMRIKDEAEKKRAREELAASYIPTWGENAEKQVGDGPFFGGAAIQVVDLKLYVVMRWLSGGALDHVPTNVLAPFAKLQQLNEAVREHPGVKAWYARG